MSASWMPPATSEEALEDLSQYEENEQGFIYGSRKWFDYYMMVCGVSISAERYEDAGAEWKLIKGACSGHKSEREAWAIVLKWADRARKGARE